MQWLLLLSLSAPCLNCRWLLMFVGVSVHLRFAHSAFYYQTANRLFHCGTATLTRNSDWPRKTMAMNVNSDDNNSHQPGSSLPDALFGKFVIPSSSIFYRSENDRSLAFVNLRPIVPGHVLVMPKTIVPEMHMLSTEEYLDVWLTVRAVQGILRQHYQCEAFNVAVQDGRAAGQSVPHVHVHILPRKAGDYERNDDIYEDLQSWAPRDELRQPGTLQVEQDNQRRDRTMQEMASEAAEYRARLASMQL